MIIPKPKAETIYPLGNGKFEACGWITYPKGSVLEGQSQECIVEIFQNLKNATAKFPGVEVSEYGRCREHRPTVAINAPASFDHCDAGEYWGENDY
mgnify:CR=1 FL=1|tara:strand:- start:586 stop:873 length:288 start_codon:yes stop_codon:yes gene_type:complete